MPDLVTAAVAESRNSFDLLFVPQRNHGLYACGATLAGTMPYIVPNPETLTTQEVGLRPSGNENKMVTQPLVVKET
jgi:hypothetical protein